jgi:voltage-gated potassium channel
MIKCNLMNRKSLSSILGMGMVSRDDHPRSIGINNGISVVHVFLSLLLMWQWQAVVHGHLNLQVCVNCDWFIWVSLLLTYGVTFSIVQQKSLFLFRNWFVLLTLLLGVFILFKTHWSFVVYKDFRPILAVIILFPALGFLIQFFLDGRLWTTVLAAFVVVGFFGLLVSGVDPNVKSAADGLWWALATVSTVGYGDVVPTSVLGRLIGGILVMVGLGVFVVITANFLGIMWRNEERNGNAQKDYLLEELDKMSQKQNDIINKIEELKSQLPKK